MSDNTFTPFRSGCGMCNASTDYTKQSPSLLGGGNKSFIANNYGIDYATSFGGARKVKKTKKGSKGKSLKKSKKIMKGGAESSGATPLPIRFYDPNAPIDDASANSGSYAVTAYGTDVLAPYPNSYQQTGGLRKKKILKKRKVLKKDSKKKLVKKKKVLKKKVMYGGMESSGATPMSQRFYDVNANLESADANSGNGAPSAYGPIQVGNVGVGMLAPYTTSKSMTANHATTQQTGGSRRKQHGGGPIPSLSDKPVYTIKNTINNAVDSFTRFMGKLETEYNKSIQTSKQIKVGDQRLIGGAKKLKKQKKVINKKKVIKKKKIQKGGDGSDFALTLNSRGPANAPDDYWGVDGKTWFQQFNKTGEYIPNSQLKYAATPELAGRGHDTVVSGFDPLGLEYGSVVGGGMKKKRVVKKKSGSKSKSPSKPKSKKSGSKSKKSC